MCLLEVWGRFESQALKAYGNRNEPGMIFWEYRRQMAERPQTVQGMILDIEPPVLGQKSRQQNRAPKGNEVSFLSQDIRTTKPAAMESTHLFEFIEDICTT